MALQEKKWVKFQQVDSIVNELDPRVLFQTKYIDEFELANSKIYTYSSMQTHNEQNPPGRLVNANCFRLLRISY